jgi:hypothetical protein
MNKDFGYLLIVSTSDTIDYVGMAYALALSIKNTQKDGYNKIALVIDDKSKIEKLSSSWVFDIVIEKELPKSWDCRSFMDQFSPFDYTVCLDVDMLFFRDLSHWIDYFVENCDLYVANKSYTFRGELVVSDYYRKAFVANDLPNLYSFYTFWKRDSELSNEFFKMARIIIENPEQFSNSFLSNYKPKILGTDESFALAAKILGIEDDISYKLEFPKVVHLKPMVQNIPWAFEKFSDVIGFYFNRSGKLKLGNYQQNDIVHYVDKDIISPEITNILEEILWKK